MAMRKWAAIGGTAGLAVACAAAVVALPDVPLRARVPPGKERRAAVAIRDDVTPFQKWGSREFTLPYVRGHYAGAWYITQSASDPKLTEFRDTLQHALDTYP